MTVSGDDPGTPFLAGRFVRLRNLLGDDGQWIEESLGNPATANYWRRATVLSPRESFLAEMRSSSDIQLVVTRISNGTPVGMVQAYGLSLIDQHASVSIATRSDVRSVGWTVEAITLFADYLFSSIDLHKLYFMMAETSPARSRRAAQWLEFEGCLRDREFRDGRLQNVYIYAMYRSFWLRTMRPALLELARAREERHHTSRPN